MAKKKGAKTLGQDDVERILQSYARTQKYTKTAKELGLSASVVRNKVKENIDSEEYARLCQLKNEEFDKRFIEYSNNVIELTFGRLITMLGDPTSKISAKDLSTILGINIDKREVLKGNNKDSSKAAGGVIVIPEADAGEDEADEV